MTTYIPKDAVTQKLGTNAGIVSPKDVYDLTIQNKYSKEGQLELLNTTTVSSVSSHDYTESGISTLLDYDIHFLTFMNIVPSTSSPFAMNFLVGGTADTSSVYRFSHRYIADNGGSADEATTTSNIYMSANSGFPINGYAYIFNLKNPGLRTMITYYTQTDNQARFGSGMHDNDSGTDGIRLRNHNGSGNFSGTLSLYGLRTA